jgi:hypothetical protein
MPTFACYEARVSKHETPMTEGFWQVAARGAFIPEYPLVQRASDRSSRWADAVILPDEPHGRARISDYPSLAGHRVIVVQTKIGRMGMYLMGQALFSARLALAAGAVRVHSVLLCHETDAALLPLLKPFPEVEVWVSDRANPRKCRRIGAARNRSSPTFACPRLGRDIRSVNASLDGAGETTIPASLCLSCRPPREGVDRNMKTSPFSPVPSSQSYVGCG